MNDAMPTPEKPWSERWAVMLKPESASSDAKPQMIGVIAVVREGEIGYRIFPDYWRKGYMSETLKMFIEMFWKMEGVSLGFLPSHHVFLSTRRSNGPEAQRC